jgi:photosystem II stability/assembly factor-like uncharacterized protein
MRYAILSALFLCIVQTGFSQGYTHFQSYASPNSYHHKQGSKVWISIGKNPDNRVIEYDLARRDFAFLNDSAPVFRSMVSDQNNGVGKDLSSQIYYTSDNWQTINSSAQTGLTSIYRTSTGFFGIKEKNKAEAEFYHSPDGNIWTKVAEITNGSNYSYRTMGISTGKVWLISNPQTYQVSNDGGLTFETRQAPGAPAITFSTFLPFDSLHGIAAAVNGNLYRTTDGGNSWGAIQKTQIRIVHPRIDSLLAYHPVEGLLLSTDTGTTWTQVSYPTPPGFTSAPNLWTVKGAYITTEISGSFYYTTGLNRPWRALNLQVKANRCIAGKGKIVIAAGEDGTYAYSHNSGRTFVPGEAPLGGEDIFACEVVNDTLVLMADRQSNIFVSRDAGVSWQKKYSNTFNYIGIKFRYSDDLSKIILRRAGQLVFSENGAESWNILGSVGGSFDATVTPSGKILLVMWYADTMRITEMKPDGSRQDVRVLNENLTPMGIEMLDEQTGYCFGIKTTTSEVYVYKTTDGWGSFTFQGKFALPAGSPIFHLPGGTDTLFINFRNTSNADASLNSIYQTFDGGKTWSTNTLTPSSDPNYKKKMQSIHFFNTGEYISVWDDYRIYLNKSLTDTGSNPNTFVTPIRKQDQLQAVIYPNPAQSVIQVESPYKIDALELYDITGKTLWSGQETQIPVSDLPAGVYYLKLFSGEKSLVRKVMKE